MMQGKIQKITIVAIIAGISAGIVAIFLTLHFSQDATVAFSVSSSTSPLPPPIRAGASATVTDASHPTSTTTSSTTIQSTPTHPQRSTGVIRDASQLEPEVGAAYTTPVPGPKPQSTTLTPLSWGVFTGSNPKTIADFENRVNENPDYLAYFVHWGNGDGALPAFLKEYAYEKDRTLVLFWEASDYVIGGTDQPAYSYRAILRGDFDAYFEDFAQQLAAYGGDVILIPFSELNGNWTPWSGVKNGNTPAEAVEAFRYLHPYFANLPNVKMGWAVNSVSVPNTPENAIEQYYPGDEYVDIVGVDGFNMGTPWYSFSDIFSAPLTTLSRYGKPIFVFSFGSAAGEGKAEWLRSGLYEILPQYPLVTGWVYFNQNKERNWLLWSDPETFSVFEKYIEE